MSIKSVLKRSRTLVQADQALHDFRKSLVRRRSRRHVELLQTLALFAPYARGAWHSRAHLAAQSAGQTFPFMVELMQALGCPPPRPTVTSQAFCNSSEGRAAAMALATLFQRYGSDKATPHDYHWVYGQVLAGRQGCVRVLEVGLGSNNEDVVSNMGRAGHPGASLRAFRDFLPGGDIVGADVDRRILFQEDRIRTYFVDQTELASFAELAEAAPGPYDLIIDDGLHTPSANIAVMIHALPRLLPNGWLIVEDISPAAAAAWDVIARLLPADRYRSQMIDAQSCLVFAVQRLSL